MPHIRHARRAGFRKALLLTLFVVERYFFLCNLHDQCICNADFFFFPIGFICFSNDNQFK